MTREIKNVSKFLQEINIKWWSILLTTILSFLDSLSNVLLLLGIGQIVAIQTSANSTKGNILKLFFGEFSCGQNFIFLFLIFLLIKIVSLSLKTFLTQQTRTRISVNMIARWAKKNPSSTSSIKTIEICNLFTKGYIGFFADSFFLLVVLGILLTYNSSIGLLYLAFIGFNIVLVQFIYALNKDKISKVKKLKSRYRRKEKLIRQYSIELAQTDRLEKETKLLMKRMAAFETADLKKNRIIALAEAITPLSFFSFLIFIAYSFPLFTNGIQASFLEITLLLIYSQGSLRRNMRATRFWVIGRAEIIRYLENLEPINFIPEPSEIRYFKNNFQLHGESLISAIAFKSVTNEKNRIIELAKSLDQTGTLAEILESEESKFHRKITREYLFFSMIIMSELDHSNQIVFDSSFKEYFNNTFLEKDTPYLKKTYLCE